jgi:RNA polymerase sigma factor (sigma-70 family)
VNEPTDQQLLRDYAERRSEPAFTALVQRYIDLVYSAAFRMTHDAQTATDVTQNVFVALAGNALQLTDRAVLAGWLHGTARNLAAKTVRSDVRRRAREKEAAIMNELLSADPDADWEHIAPQLDTALGELTEVDRDVVLLRYFKNHDLRTVGAKLGISDDAAQKRVSRAVERLREIFAKRGVGIGASGLVFVMSANAVQAAPVGLAVTISTAATLAGSTLLTTGAITTTKAIAMTALQKTIVAATIAVLSGAGIYEARQAAQLREQVQTLGREQVPLAEQIQQLRSERDTATSRLNSLADELAKIKAEDTDHMEVLGLRGKVGGLQHQANEAIKKADDPFVKTALNWKARAETLHQLFAENPEQRVPELQLLIEQDWLNLAQNMDLESPDGIRRALSEVRHAAKNRFVPVLQQALKSYIDSNDGNLPNAVADLKPYFENPIDETLLDQYELLYTGKMSDVPGNYVLKGKQVDPEYDYPWQIGPNAYSPGSSGNGTSVREASMESLKPVISAFMAANNGQLPKTIGQLKPFLTTPDQQRAFEQMSNEGLRFSQPK